MPGKCRPCLRKKALENLKRSNLSETDKKCIVTVFERFENMINQSDGVCVGDDANLKLSIGHSSESKVEVPECEIQSLKTEVVRLVDKCLSLEENQEWMRKRCVELLKSSEFYRGKAEAYEFCISTKEGIKRCR